MNARNIFFISAGAVAAVVIALAVIFTLTFSPSGRMVHTGTFKAGPVVEVTDNITDVATDLIGHATITAPIESAAQVAVDLIANATK